MVITGSAGGKSYRLPADIDTPELFIGMLIDVFIWSSHSGSRIILNLVTFPADIDFIADDMFIKMQTWNQVLFFSGTV